MTFYIPKIEVLSYSLKEGWYIFQGLFNMTLINNSIIVILGIFSTTETVGYYSIAEKLIRAITKMTSPISQAVYPYLAKMYKVNKQKAYIFSIKLTGLVSIVMLFVSLIIIIFAQELLTILFTSNKVNEISILSLQILSFFPMVSSIVHIFCTQNMIYLNMKNMYSKVYLIASLFNIIIALIFIPKYSYIAAATIVIATEIIIGIGMSYYITRKVKDDK
jgi:PST family polysaccharide transporter